MLGRYSNLHDQGERVQTLLQIVPEGTSEVNSRTPRQLQRRLGPAEKGQLISQHQAGETVKELAVRHILHRPKGVPPERIDEVIADYEGGMSLAVIGDRLSVDAATVALALRKAGIELRPRRGWSARRDPRIGSG